MNRLAISLLVIFGLFFAGYSLSRHRSDFEKFARSVSGRSYKVLDWGFRPIAYTIENRPFVVVVVAHNQGAWVDKTLDSIFSQRYNSFRMIFIDDASSDGSAEHAKGLIERSGHLVQTTFVQNETQLGTAANLLRAVESCREDEIVIAMEGSGRLAHEWVLERLNQYYADPDLWLAYGQYRQLPDFQIGHNQPFSAKTWNESGVRGHPNVASRFVSFYASLFKKIVPADLMYNGKWIASSEEFFFLAPLFEMAKGHFHFISEVLYLTPEREVVDPELDMRIEKHMRSQSAYLPLHSLREREEGAI